jgi:hypothetical protein
LPELIELSIQVDKDDWEQVSSGPPVVPPAGLGRADLSATMSFRYMGRYIYCGGAWPVLTERPGPWGL